MASDEEVMTLDSADEDANLLHPLLQDTEPANLIVASSHKLYISHFLSTWNSRVFEFGAVLYLGAIFPGTLLPMSVYAIIRGLSALLFAPLIGQYIDLADRLRCVRLSIVLQRIAVGTSCVFFFLLSKGIIHGASLRNATLALLALISCFEKLGSIMNTVSVERDWVVVIAGNDGDLLIALNAQMRRIDLFCKLLGPLSIGLATSLSTEAAIIINFAMNLASVFAEYIAIASIYHSVPDLRYPKKQPPFPLVASEDIPLAAPAKVHRNYGVAHNLAHFRVIVRQFSQDFRMYFGHRAFLPSLAGALLYLTVLSFAGQMVTYLLAAGYTATQISVARTFSVGSEVAATWVGPWLMQHGGPIRAGLWSSTWQVASLVAGLTTFWVYGNADMHFASASGLVVGTIVSRVGLMSFDLCIQSIIEEVGRHH